MITLYIEHCLQKGKPDSLGLGNYPSIAKSRYCRTSIISTSTISTLLFQPQNQFKIGYLLTIFVLLYLNFAFFFIVLYGISIISKFDYFNYPRSQLVEIIEVLLYFINTLYI
jgi:hypothetical protein